MAYEWTDAGGPNDSEGGFDGISSTTPGGGSGTGEAASTGDSFDGISSTTPGGGSGSDG